MHELVFNQDPQTGRGCGYVEPTSGIAPASNAYNTADPHEASLTAGHASMRIGHPSGLKKATNALMASKNRDSSAAAEHHGAAARLHEQAGARNYGNGNHEQGDAHMEAGALHRKAASLHKSMLPDDDDDVDDNSREDLHGRMIDKGANATPESLAKVPSGQGRADVPAANTYGDVRVAPSWNNEGTWRAHVENQVARDVAERNRVDVVMHKRGDTFENYVSNARQLGPVCEFFESGPPMLDAENVSPELLKRLGITLNSPLRDQSGSEVRRDQLYDTPPMKGPGRGPSYDGRSFTRDYRRMGMSDEENEEQEITPLQRLMGDEQAGEIDEQATKASAFGARSWDSHSPEDVAGYGEVIQSRQPRYVSANNAARQQQMAEQERRAFEPLGGGGRPVGNADEFGLSAASLTAADMNASASMKQYLGIR